MARVLSFDADGTLVTRDFVDLFWEEGVPALYASENGISFEEAKEYVMKKYAEIGEEDIRWYLPKYWFDVLRLQENPGDLIKKYEGHLKLYPEVIDVLKELGEDYELIVSSNAARDFLDIEVEKIKHYFSHIFSSTSDFGEVRKTPDFYSKVCEILKVKPSEIVHVGDHWNFDFVVPRKLGIEAFYLDRDRGGQGSFVLKDLRDLKHKLSRG
ncbi:MAG: HAD family hydrolase [Euryarchaeota archaeon]|nr:HAD family hydrolase [Euryarchaeota archaeon]